MIREAQNWHMEIFKQGVLSALEQEKVPKCSTERPGERNFSFQTGKNNRFTDFKPTFRWLVTRKESRHPPTRKTYHLGIFWRLCLKNIHKPQWSRPQSKIILLWWHFKGIKMKKKLSRFVKCFPEGVWSTWTQNSHINVALTHLSCSPHWSCGVKRSGSLKWCCTVLKRHAPYANKYLLLLKLVQS